eukprot:4932844-Heterocapsa_arctica.AAC.1
MVRSASGRRILLGSSDEQVCTSPCPPDCSCQRARAIQTPVVGLDSPAAAGYANSDEESTFSGSDRPNFLFGVANISSEEIIPPRSEAHLE